MEKNFEIVDNVLVGKAYESGVNETCINKLLIDSFNEAPEFVGQYDIQTDKEITFAEMKDRSIRCALWLKKLGIGKDDIVAISTPHQINDYVPLLATLYLGAIFNPWYHKLAERTQRQLFELIHPKVMFVDSTLISELSTIAASLNVQCQFISYGDHPDFKSLDQILAEQTQDEVDKFKCVEINDLGATTAAIFFSSGTTGSPKGVCVSYGTFVNDRTDYVFSSNGINKLWYSSLAWMTGASCMLSAITQKRRRFIHRRFSPEDTSRVVEKYKINWLFIKGPMINQMWVAGVFQRYDFSSLEVILSAGTKLNLTAVRDVKKMLPHVLLLDSYGMTEAGGWVTTQTKANCKLGSIGCIVDTAKLKIIDLRTGRALGPNERGEIVYKVKYCMQGYYENPKQTEEVIDKEGWVHSGDEGFFDEDGEITITDRIKRIIIVSGNHISPSLVENLLMAHPAVEEASVIGVPHDMDIEQLMAFVKLRPGAQVSKEELIELPAKHDKFMRLNGGVVFMDELPHNAAGKVVVGDLKKIAEAYHTATGIRGA